MQWLKGLKLALIGCLVIVLGACGDSGQQSEKVVDQAGQQPAATRKFETVMGEIEIPKEPKRIVATQYLGHLLTLGVKPVGAGTASLNQYFCRT